MADMHVIFFHFLIVLLTGQQVYGDAVALDDSNIDTILSGNDVVLVNFYADWCRFSQILQPTFNEAAAKIKEEFQANPGKVVFAKVDSDKEVNIAGKYRINKYPTIKLFRGGNVIKKEYRGQRSVEHLVQFAKEQAKDPVEEMTSLDNLDTLDEKKLHVVGYFDNKDSENYRTFSRVSNVLRDSCVFHAAIGPVSETRRPLGDNAEFIHKDKKVPYLKDLSHFETLSMWAQEHCTPLVREITFENAEELTEEGLPFLILFHNPEDTESVEKFTRAVTNQIYQEKEAGTDMNVNFLVADGLKFAHPLHHLGKSTSDLPILAIDSFRHMYLFPHDVKRDIETPGVLKAFIEGLHSGKLHREFHHGPDTPQVEEKKDDPSPDSPEANNIPRDSSDEPNVKKDKPTSPPESTFRKLAPSHNRYTILRDEL